MLNKSDLIRCFSKLGIELDKNVNLELKLENDMDMDSQEIIELLEIIKSEQNIQSDSIFINRNDSIGKIINKVNCLSQDCEFSRVDCIEVDTEPNTVLKRIWDFEQWETILPHINRIENIYCDNDYQEFFMEVKDFGNILKVKSSRILLDKCIYFYQPLPPVYLETHKGKWEFVRSKEGTTNIKLTHSWSIDKRSINKNINIINQELMEHAETTLLMWKEIFDGNKGKYNN